MIEVYIMPVGSEDSANRMHTTLLNSINRQKILEYGTTPPGNSYENYKVNVWGLTPGPQNTRQWERFKPNDIVIFVPSNSDLMVTEIIQTFRNKGLAKELWDIDDHGQTWELMFFVKELGTVGKTKRTFLSELGYSENDRLQGNRRITEIFFSKYNSIENLLNS